MKNNFVKLEDFKVKDEKDQYCKFIPGVGIQLFYDKDFPSVGTLKDDPVKYSMLSTFNFSKKTIYMNIGDKIAQCINYFRKYYETEGNLTFIYMRLNLEIINSGADLATANNNNTEFIDNLPVDKFIEKLCLLFLNKRILDSIDKLVEDNYFEFDMMKKKKKSTKASVVDAVQFNTEHAKACLRFSIASKLMIPVIGQYAEFRLQRSQNTAFFMQCFKLILKKICGDKCDLEVKLRAIAKLAVEQTKTTNRPMWEKMEICDGGTVHNKINDIMKHLIQNMPKIVFEKALVAYFHNIANKQVAFLFRQKFESIHQLDENRDEDGLSDFDKVEINIIKDDESRAILNDKNAELTIKELTKIYGEISEDELDFYREHIEAEEITDLQRSLLFYIFAKDFGGLKQIYSVNYEGYLKLICIAKRKLKPYGLIFIPQFISAKMNKINTRKTINTILLKKLELSPQYSTMLNSKYKNTQLMVDGKSVIVTMMSKFMNTPMFIIDYNMYVNSDVLLNKLEVSPDIMIDEFIRVIDTI